MMSVLDILIVAARRHTASVRLAGAALVLALLGSPARGDGLNPNDFASLGTLTVPSSSSDSYVFDTTNLTLRNTTTNTLLFTGTTTTQSATVNGQPLSSSIAVFDFSAVSLAGGTFTATGSRPLALLSRGSLSLTDAARLIASGGVGGPGVAGSNVPGAAGLAGAGGGNGGVGVPQGQSGGNGAGPGAGGGGMVNSFFGSGGGAGGFDGNGGNGGGSGGGSAGLAYGDLTQILQGGSGGGG